MNKKIVFVLVILSLCLVAVLGMNMISPAQVQAHPQYGFTPEPPPPPPPPPPEPPSPPPGGGGDDGDGPAHYAVVQVGQCDVTCLPGYGDSGQVGSAAGGLNVVLHVQLVHQGSGWIADGYISTDGDTYFALPYSGEWEVFLVDPPEFVTGIALDTGVWDLESLYAALANGPVYLGLIEANLDQAQWVECPLVCLWAEPEFLPQTGVDRVTASTWIKLGGAFLFIGILLIILAYGLQQAKYLKL